MRVLFVSPYYYPATAFGGPVWSMKEMASGLTGRRVQVAVITTNADKPQKRRPGSYWVDGVPVSCHRQVGYGSWAFSPGLGWDVFRRLDDTDVVYAPGVWTWPGLAACAAARRARRPYVMSPRGSFDPWALRYRGTKKALYLRLIEKRNLRDAAAVHCLTHREAAQVQAILPEARCRVVPNAVSIDTEVPPETRTKFETEFPELSGKRIALFLSRIHPKKGLDILVPAFARLAPRVPDAHLVIAGPDENGYRAALERLAEKERITARVTFTGLVNGERKRAVLALSQVFVLPSYSEGLPVSVLEGMAFRLPVVITEHCNLNEEVVGARAGLIVNTTASSVAKALERMLLDPCSSREMGAAGRKLVEQKFSPAAVGSQVVAMFEDALAGVR